MYSVSYENLLVHLNNAISVAIQCVGYDMEKVKIYKDHILIKKPYPLEFEEFKKYIENYDKNYLDDRMFEL